ncbi:bifunctional 2-polyprenyl-6-hydroxyphenol methylase/3-demethylubiquinol 3-O-methyltransferase UbiG [Thermaurantiacus sp.]
MVSPSTADSRNLALFEGLAKDWWDPDGPNRLLHRLHPARMAYVRDAAVAHFGLDSRARRPLSGLAALDVGCGGGLVSESLARMGAEVTGLDAAAGSIAVAREHAAGQNLSIRYHCGEIGDLAGQLAPQDLVTCLEVIEHVTDVASFLRGLRRAIREGGLLLFSSPNRTAASLAVVKIGAEYVAGALPRGTHDWRRFLTPDELSARLAVAGFRVEEVKGVSWTPARGFLVGDSTDIAYIGRAVAT